jgi:hypothetical protein
VIFTHLKSGQTSTAPLHVSVSRAGACPGLDLLYS